MKYFALLISFLILTSCGGAHRIAKNERKANRKIAKAILLNPDVAKKDTVKVDTTVFTPLRTVDTITTIKEILRSDTIKLVDTVTKVNVRLVRDKEIVRVRAECPPDTIRITKEIPVEKIVYQTNLEEIRKLQAASRRQWWLIIALAVMNIIQFLRSFLKK